MRFDWNGLFSQSICSRTLGPIAAVAPASEPDEVYAILTRERLPSPILPILYRREEQEVSTWIAWRHVVVAVPVPPALCDQLRRPRPQLQTKRAGHKAIRRLVVRRQRGEVWCGRRAQCAE